MTIEYTTEINDRVVARLAIECSISEAVAQQIANELFDGYTAAPHEIESVMTILFRDEHAGQSLDICHEQDVVRDLTTWAKLYCECYDRIRAEEMIEASKAALGIARADWNRISGQVIQFFSYTGNDSSYGEVNKALKDLVESKIGECESLEKQIPPEGFRMISVESDYYGSHSEYGEGDYTEQYAVPMGWKRQSIQCSHGHFSENRYELAKLPIETLVAQVRNVKFSDEDNVLPVLVDWVPFYEEEDVREARKPAFLQHLSSMWVESCLLQCEWFAGGRRGLLIERDLDTYESLLSTPTGSQYQRDYKEMLEIAIKEGFTEQDLRDALEQVVETRDGEVSCINMIDRYCQTQIVETGG